jgi:hypothetical protein
MSRHKPTTKRVLDILNEIAPAPDIPKNLPPHEAAMFAGEDHDDDDHRSLDRCHTSGKVCFPSQRFANRVMRQIQKKRNHYLRTYFCPDCKSFHLSSAKRK